MVELYTVCWNEEVRLPYFLRHYRDVDVIHLYDNDSTDRTVELAAADSRVRVHRLDTGGKYTEAAQMHVRNNAWRGSKADWVIVCDVDELLYYPDHRLLDSVGSATILHPYGYDMISAALPTTSGQLYEEVNRGVYSSGFDKLVAFRPSAVEPNYSPGCHHAQPRGDVRYFRSPQLLLLHFHYLSAEWTWARHQAVGRRMSQENISYRWGVQYLWTKEKFAQEFQRLWSNARPLFDAAGRLLDNNPGGMEDTL